MCNTSYFEFKEVLSSTEIGELSISRLEQPPFDWNKKQM